METMYFIILGQLLKLILLNYCECSDVWKLVSASGGNQDIGQHLWTFISDLGPVSCAVFCFQSGECSFFRHENSTCLGYKRMGEGRRVMIGEPVLRKGSFTKYSPKQNEDGRGHPSRSSVFSKLLVLPYIAKAYSYQLNIETGKLHPHSMFNIVEDFLDVIYLRSMGKLYVSMQIPKGITSFSMNGGIHPEVVVHDNVQDITADEDKRIMFYSHKNKLKRIGLLDGEKRSHRFSFPFMSLTTDTYGMRIYAAASYQMVSCNYDLGDLKVLSQGNMCNTITIDPVGQYIIFITGTDIMRWSMQRKKPEKVLSLEKRSTPNQILFYDSKLYISFQVNPIEKHGLVVWNLEKKERLLEQKLPDDNNCKRWILCLVT